MAAYTDFSFMRPGNGDGDGEEPKNKKPLSENEKIAIAQSEREKMLEYMRHPSYKERLKKEMFGDVYEASRKGQNRMLEKEYAKRLQEVATIPINRPDFDLSIGSEMTAAGTYVPHWADVNSLDSPYIGQKGSAIYINQDPTLGEHQTNPALYGQVVGHELGHASHIGNVGGGWTSFVKKPIVPALLSKLFQHGELPQIKEKKAVFTVMEPYFPRYSKKDRQLTYDLASKRLGPGKAEEIFQAMSNMRKERAELEKKYKDEYDPQKHGPEISEMLMPHLENKRMYDYLEDNATEVGARMIGLRKLAAEKFGHDMNEDFDIKKYKDQIQEYFKKNGLLNEYEHLSKDLELSDDEINEMMKYIAKAKGEPSVSRYTA
jgi:hypothetical protein